MWNARLDESQGGIKIARRNIDNLRCADDTTLVAENDEEWESLLMRVKEEGDKAGLKLKQTRLMPSSPITSRQIDGEKVKAGADFISLGSKITADSSCSHEIKTLAPCKESCDKPRQCIKKQRHLFVDKGPYCQSYGFSSRQV